MSPFVLLFRPKWNLLYYLFARHPREQKYSFIVGKSTIVNQNRHPLNAPTTLTPETIPRWTSAFGGKNGVVTGQLGWMLFPIVTAV
jgi:hypothetical protein